MDKKQLFFSHSWRPDNLFRDNHKRVVKMAKIMSVYGWNCWIDENEMFGNIDACIASGIENCDCVLVFITESYCKKINEAAHNPNIRDNCLKEWTYANNRNKLMIPIIMEPCLLNTSYWPDGIINLYFGSTLYVDYTEDNISNVIKNLIKLLNKHDIYCNSKKSNNNNNKYNNHNNSIIRNIKAFYFLNKMKAKNKINLLPPSPINGSPSISINNTPNFTPNITPNITPNVSNQSLNMLSNRSDEGSPLKKNIEISFSRNNRRLFDLSENENFNTNSNFNINSNFNTNSNSNFNTNTNSNFNTNSNSNFNTNSSNKYNGNIITMNNIDLVKNEISNLNNGKRNIILNNRNRNIRHLFRC